MEKFTIIFLRHGESEANLLDIFQGQSDTSLSKRGHAQVVQLAKRWLKEDIHFDTIISSPLVRARQTAEIIGDILGKKVELDPIWIERDTGKLTGMNRKEASNTSYFYDFFTPYQGMGETGESDFDLFLRAGKALTSLIKRPAGSYLVVSHGGILNQVLHVILGLGPQANGQGVTFRLVNTGFAKLTYDPARFKWTLAAFNDHAHLKNGDVDGSILEL